MVCFSQIMSGFVSIDHGKGHAFPDIGTVNICRKCITDPAGIFFQ